MVRAVVDHVTALAQAPEVAQPVVARVIIEVRRREHDAGVADLRRFDEIGPTRGPTSAVTPGVTGGIEPAAVGQTANGHAMRPTASLAHAGGALEPHPPADLRPIARIKLPHLRPDRHRYPVCRDRSLFAEQPIDARPANAEPARDRRRPELFLLRDGDTPRRSDGPR